MNKRFILCSMMFVIFFAANAFSADNKDDRAVEKSGFISFIEKPLHMILGPAGAEGLADIVSRPVSAVLGEVPGPDAKTVITPGRTHEYIYNVNKSASVVDKEDIERMDPKDLQDVLARQSGIMVNGCLNNAKDGQIDMRGFGEAGPMNYVLLVDGRRTNQIDLSGADLSQIDISSVDRIEILRGANSVLYGDNATGGVINVITKKGGAGHHVEYAQEFGSYQYAKERVTVKGSEKFLDYFTNYACQDSDGYRLNNGYEAQDLFSSFTMKPEENVNVCFSSAYHKDWYGQPGAMYPINIQRDGLTGSRFPDSKAKTEDYYFEVDPRVSGEVCAQQIALSCPVSYRSRRAESLSVSFNRYESGHHIQTIDLRPKAEIGSDLFDGTVENKLVLGMDAYHSRDRILSGDITFTKSQLDITKDTFGIYASDTALVAKRFLLSAGVRGDWARYKFDQFQPAPFYDTQDPREAAFETGLGYKYNERSQIYANFARSYRYPATDEFFQSAYESLDYSAVLNAGLKPQTGNNYEIGIKDNSFGVFDANAAYYVNDNKNEIYYDPITFQNENYHHVMHHGLELEAGADVYKKIRPFLRYTYEKAYFVGGKFASKTVPLVPENKVTVGAGITPVEPLSFEAALNYVGQRYAASDQTNQAGVLKPYTTMDLGVNFRVKNLRAFLKLNNIFSTSYYSNGTKNWMGNVAFYPAPEFNMQGGVSVSF
jgi:iron complex outermembrane receptor protein